MSRAGTLWLVGLLGGCGAPEAVDLALRIPISWPQTGSCELTHFRAPNVLTARITLSGNYGTCADVRVDAAALTVEAFCPEITTDIVRYLCFEYELADAASRSADLLAILAPVDLRPQAVGRKQSLTVDLTNPAPPASILIATPTAYVELPVSDAACAALAVDSPERHLCGAERWWLDSRATTPPDYDRDDDGEPNIDEACAGTLFP